MKRYLLTCVFLFTSFHLWAQQYATVGSGTSSNTSTAFPAPMGNTNYGAKHQMLVTASELSAAGMAAGSDIYSVGFDVTNTNSMAPLQNWQITVFTTSATDPLAAGWVTSGQVAYSLPMTLTLSGTGWVQIPLYHFFTWNGTDNLVIQTCFNNPTSSFNASLRRTTGLTSGGATVFTKNYRANVAGVCDSSLSSQANNTRSNIRFAYSSTLCAGTPVVGAVSTSHVNPAVETTVLLSLAGTYPTDATIQWEEATSPGGPWTPVAGATNVHWQYSVYFTRYYRAAVTCGGNTGYSSNNVLVTVQDYFAAGTYTINNALPTAAGNFNTFAAFDSAASLTMVGHVTANVAPGNYTERLIITTPMTAANKTITINGNGATIMHTTATSAQRAAVVLENASYVTIKNFTINGYSTSAAQHAWGVLLKQNCDYDTIANCNIILDSNTTSDHYAGIVVTNSNTDYAQGGTNSDFNALTNNTINGGYYGISLTGPTDGFYIAGNTVRNFQEAAIVLGTTNNVLVKNNDIHRKERTTVSDFVGIYATASTRLKIHGNRIHDPGTAIPGADFDVVGVQLVNTPGVSNTLNNEVHNNLVYNMNGIGDHHYFYNEQSGNTDIYNNSINTVFNQSIVATGVTVAYYHYSDDAIPYVRFRNNDILIDRKTNNNIKMVMYIEDGEERIKSGFNNYFINGPGYNYFAYAEGEYCPTKAPFIANHNPWEISSVSLRPMQVDAAAGNLHPTNPSLNGLGDNNLFAPEDISGTPRNASAPDIGAYEFTPTTCLNYLTAYAFTYDTLVCPGGPVELTMRNTGAGTGATIAWQSSPANSGTWINIPTLSTGTGTYTAIATMPAVATDFRAVITCGATTAYSQATYVDVAPSYMCYCSPRTGDTLYQATDHYNWIENVMITGTALNSPTPGTGRGSYDLKSHAITSNTAILTAGITYSLVTQPAIVPVIAWIDFNKNGIYETTEVVSGANFTVPGTVTDGPTGMRLRSTYSYPLGAGDACFKYSYAFSGETEDYVVTLNDPLKIDMTSIAATNAGTRNRVNWATGAEDKGDYFEIERSADGKSFGRVGTQQANGAASSYTYWDNSPVAGVNYYRLKLNNADGSASYSDVVTATVTSNTLFGLEVFPNPAADDEVTVRTWNTDGAHGVVTITDVTGKVLSTVQMKEQTATISLSGLAPGIYLVKYADKDHNETLKITRQ